MTEPMDADADAAFRRLIEAGDSLQGRVRATEADVGVSERRLFVVWDRGVRLDVPIERIRRIQLDIERDRPATLVVVPQVATDEPQVLSIPPTEYEAAARVVVLLGLGLAKSNSVRP
jgi:hypothetical protein